MRRRHPQQGTQQPSAGVSSSPVDGGVFDNSTNDFPAAFGGGPNLGQPAAAGLGSPAYNTSRGMSFPGAGAPPFLGADVDGRLRDSKGKKGGFKDWKRR